MFLVILPFHHAATVLHLRRRSSRIAARARSRKVDFHSRKEARRSLARILFAMVALPVAVLHQSCELAGKLEQVSEAPDHRVYLKDLEMQMQDHSSECRDHRLQKQQDRPDQHCSRKYLGTRQNPYALADLLLLHQSQDHTMRDSAASSPAHHVVLDHPQHQRGHNRSRGLNRRNRTDLHRQHLEVIKTPRQLVRASQASSLI
mmetsp:Transcript_62393/g.97105  ORF Transcript_62393/g.97105 Transcript_62393/m.97105 type:complete len:203 (-) Transcript_62393:515-1123(-)